ncbi:MAG: hypothetical protein K0R03_2621 [Moraxellaceae bacterium]|jgi:hypothetical protein|nr:hypothetical protein [Moraxellaceae bacterium]
MSTPAKVFTPALRSVVVEPLREAGFTFDGSRTFRCVAADGSAARIINFQLGQRAMAGQFAVNLGVFLAGPVPKGREAITPEKAMEFHCEPAQRQRLGLLLPPRVPLLARLPVIGMLFGPQDLWWECSADQDYTGRELRRALSALQRHGLPWLETTLARATRSE